LYKRDSGPFREDLPKLLAMLERGELRPRIAARLPLLDAKRGIEMLVAGGRLRSQKGRRAAFGFPCVPGFAYL
jgi:hypothetical protein